MFSIRSTVKTLLGLLCIGSVVTFLRYPVLVNSSFALHPLDEAPPAWLMKSLMDGAPLFFYFSDINYHGLSIGLAAIPFFWIFGVNALAYKLPALMFHSIYILTTYFIAKKIDRSIGLLVVFLMLLAPWYIIGITCQNWPHHLVALLGNIAFLIAMKLKTPDQENKRTLIFFLFMIFGFAIYTYTYSILFIFTILVVFVLTHESWKETRSHILSLKLKNFFKNSTSVKLKIVRVLDLVIFFFILGVLFSYIFGGFGLDIAGISIFQINNLHKPVFQVIILLTLRFLIYRSDLKLKINQCMEYIKTFGPEAKFLIFLSSSGFLIGISPRILSILSGQITRGGTGFDLDFSPISLASHFLRLFTYSFPTLLGLDHIYASITEGIVSPYSLVMTISSVVILCLVLIAVFSFFTANIKFFKNVFLAKNTDYKPELILIVFFITVCVANIISMTGPFYPRYIYPLYMVLVIWVCLYLKKIQKRSFTAFVFILVVWSGFYLDKLYINLQETGFIKDHKVTKKADPLFDVIKFCRSKGIKVAYGDYYYVYKANFLGNNSPFFVEYLKKPLYYGSNYFRIKAEQSRNQPNFAIITSTAHSGDYEDRPDRIYLNFFKNNSIDFNKVSLDRYTVYFDFKGPSLKINELPILMSDHVT